MSKESGQREPRIIMANSAGSVDAQWIHGVVQKYERRLVLYVSRIIGDVERARDVVQDTFLKLCEQDRQKIEGYLSEWLYTVSRNRALDVVRKESRMVRLAEGAAGWQPSSEDGPTQRIEVDESTRLVLALIAGLPDKQREAIRLKFQNGLSYRQISRVMDLTTSYVGYLIHAGLNAVREQLNSDDVGPVARIPGPSRRATP